VTSRTAILGLLLLAASSAQTAVTQETVKEVVRDSACDNTGLAVIGEVERIVLEPSGTVMEARIDSGATTSSIDARDLESYEKDGKPWVKFTIPAAKAEPAAYDLPVVRVASIKRHGAEPIERPVVELTVRLGDMAEPTEFSLADRGNFAFPVLLGRNFLSTRFLVNVARKHLIKTRALPKTKEGATQ
jgi:hypothetical protein